VQIQLCEFCLKSGMLCNKCQAKVQSGEVSDQYIEVAKLLLEMENQYQFLQKVRLDNVLEAGGFLVLIVGKGDAAKFNADPINIIWLPDGSTETRVVLQGRGNRRLSKKRLQALVNVAKTVRNMDLRVEYAY